MKVLKVTVGDDPEILNVLPLLARAVLTVNVTDSSHGSIVSERERVMDVESALRSDANFTCVAVVQCERALETVVQGRSDQPQLVRVFPVAEA